MTKTSLTILFISTILLLGACNNKTKGSMETSTFNKENVIFPKGKKGSAEWFSGTVWVTNLMQPNENLTYAIGDVKFEPRARTYWHIHPIEQILLVTEGKGYYQEKGKLAISLHKGNVIVIPPNTEHWHGATSDSHLIHVAITNYKDDECVQWLQPVTEEEYNQL